VDISSLLQHKKHDEVKLENPSSLYENLPKQKDLPKNGNALPEQKPLNAAKLKKQKKQAESEGC